MNKTKALEVLEQLSQKYGTDPLLVQGAGGNTSVKTDDGQMLVKASGFALKDLTVDKGWVQVPFATVSALVSAGRDATGLDPSLDDWLASAVDKTTSSPSPNYKASIEAAMHAVLGPIVVHVHPVGINTILCAENGRDLCQQIFANVPFVWIDPLPPGYYLARAIKDALNNSAYPTTPRVIFLASHGVIVHGKTENEISSGYEKILTLSHSWFKDKGVTKMSLDVTDWESEIAEDDIFPDTVVFHSLAKNLGKVAPEKKRGLVETFAASKLIRSLHQSTGLRSRVLDKDVCDYILGMSREKHRQKLATKD